MITDANSEQRTLGEYRTIIDRYYHRHADKKYKQPTKEEYKIIIDRCHQLRAEALHHSYISFFEAIKNRIKKIFMILHVGHPKPHFSN